MFLLAVEPWSAACMGMQRVFASSRGLQHAWVCRECLLLASVGGLHHDATATLAQSERGTLARVSTMANAHMHCYTASQRRLFRGMGMHLPAEP